MIGDRATRLAIHEDFHVIATQRDHALADAERAEKRAEDQEVTIASLERSNAALRRQVREYQAVLERRTEQLAEARARRVENVKVGPALAATNNGGAIDVQPGSEGVHPRTGPGPL